MFHGNFASSSLNNVLPMIFDNDTNLLELTPIVSCRPVWFITLSNKLSVYGEMDRFDIAYIFFSKGNRFCGFLCAFL